MTTIELVRHATAVGRKDWWGRPDRERPLSEAGTGQARAMCRELSSGEAIGALYSSPLRRCLETLEWLAGELGLDVARDDGLAEATSLPVLDGGDAWVASAWLAGRALAFVDRVLEAHEGQRVVACSHGDVIPALMAVLVGRDQLDLSDVRCPKGGWFTLRFEGGRCVDVRRHGAPER